MKIKEFINLVRLPILVFIVVAWCNNKFQLSVWNLFGIYVVMEIILTDKDDNILQKAAEILIGVLLLGWLRDIPPINMIGFSFNYFGETWAFASAISSVFGWGIAKIFEFNKGQVIQ